MTNEEKKAVFIDLYELYQESELEEETMIWMKEHEQFFQDQAEAAAAGNRELPGMQKTDDHQKLLHIKIFVYSLYGAFLLLSIWMTVWFFSKWLTIKNRRLKNCTGNIIMTLCTICTGEPISLRRRKTWRRIRF